MQTAAARQTGLSSKRDNKYYMLLAFILSFFFLFLLGFFPGGEGWACLSFERTGLQLRPLSSPSQPVLGFKTCRNSFALWLNDSSIFRLRKGAQRLLSVLFLGFCILFPFPLRSPEQALSSRLGKSWSALWFGMWRRCPEKWSGAVSHPRPSALHALILCLNCEEAFNPFLEEGSPVGKHRGLCLLEAGCLRRPLTLYCWC